MKLPIIILSFSTPCLGSIDDNIYSVGHPGSESEAFTSTISPAEDGGTRPPSRFRGKLVEIVVGAIAAAGIATIIHRWMSPFNSGKPGR